MIWTLKIELLQGIYAKEPWLRLIEIDSSATLEDVHLAIQDAVDFDDDHLYEFYVARTAWSRSRVRFDDEEGGIYNTTLADLFPLPKDRKLFYMFDYGDSWLFGVSLTRKRRHEPLPDVEYPRAIEKVGENPDQYPDYDG